MTIIAKSEGQMFEPRLSVVIATRDRPADLRRLMGSLCRQTLAPMEVIVIDDASTPAVTVPSHVRLIRNAFNRGSCLSRNHGFAVATGDMVACFDDDAELLDDRLLEKAVRLLLSVEDAAVVGFRQVQPDGTPFREQPVHASQISRGRSFSGYGFLARRRAWLEVGGFLDLPYAEEREVSLRFLDAGWSVLFDPSLSVVHYEDRRGRDKAVQKLRFKNSMAITLLRYPAAIIPYWLLRAPVGHVRRMYRSGLPDWRGMGAAFVELSRMLPMIVRERRKVKLRTLQRSLRLFHSPEPL
jgi:GT2 family glycosyltransferase